MEHHDAAAIRLVQLTDSHLFGTPDGSLVGMNTTDSLHDVLQLVALHEPHAAALLFTGDASQDHSAASYRQLLAALARSALPQYWIPGNHDELSLMQQVVAGRHPCGNACFRTGNWQVILLDSSLAGKVHGWLAGETLAFLQDCLRASPPDEHVLVALHHNPVPVAAAWLQRHCLQNAEALFAVLDAYPQVRAVVFGHVHQELEVRRKGVRYFGTPSTCVQFHPSSAEFALDDRNPGYRWLDLHPDGTLVSAVRRVTGKRYEVDFSGVGY